MRGVRLNQTQDGRAASPPPAQKSHPLCVSRGADWGEDGFIRLQYGKDACGLTNDPTWVTVIDAVPSPAPLAEEERAVVEDVLAPRPREVADLRHSIEELAKPLK